MRTLCLQCVFERRVYSMNERMCEINELRKYNFFWFCSLFCLLATEKNMRNAKRRARHKRIARTVETKLSCVCAKITPHGRQRPAAHTYARTRYSCICRRTQFAHVDTSTTTTDYHMFGDAFVKCTRAQCTQRCVS